MEFRKKIKSEHLFCEWDENGTHKKCERKRKLSTQPKKQFQCCRWASSSSSPFINDRESKNLHEFPVDVTTMSRVNEQHYKKHIHWNLFFCIVNGLQRQHARIFVVCRWRICLCMMNRRLIQYWAHIVHTHFDLIIIITI